MDEMFGVTHSKQGVNPRTELKLILSPDMEAIARTLNRRVREAFDRSKRPETRRELATVVGDLRPQLSGRCVRSVWLTRDRAVLGRILRYPKDPSAFGGRLRGRRLPGYLAFCVGLFRMTLS